MLNYPSIVVLDWSMEDFIQEYLLDDKAKPRFPKPEHTGDPRVVDAPTGLVVTSKDGYMLLILLPNLHRSWHAKKYEQVS